MSNIKQSIVIFSNVVKNFGTVQALRGISFEIRTGEAFAILGHNGAGKTTSIRLMLGLLKPDSGEVRLFGNDPYPENELNREIRQRIGVVQEEDRLYLNMNGEENIMFWLALYGIPKHLQKEKAFSALSLVGLEKRGRGKVSTYSKGMRRRLAIARALALEPQMLILDEPTVGLDPEARVEVRELLERLIYREGLTLLMTSHDLDEVEKLCERLMVIDHGKALLAGTLSELQAGQQPALSIKLINKNKMILPESLLQELAAIPSVVHVQLVDNDLTVILEQDNEEIINQVVARIIQADIGISAVNLRKHSLEEIYLQAIENSTKKNNKG